MKQDRYRVRISVTIKGSYLALVRRTSSRILSAPERWGLGRIVLRTTGRHLRDYLPLGSVSHEWDLSPEEFSEKFPEFVLSLMEPK